MGIAAVFLAFAGAVLFATTRDSRRPEGPQAAPASGPPAAGLRPFPPVREPMPSDASTSRPAPEAAVTDAADEDDSERWKTAQVEEIKQALYELEIDSVDRLHLLDEFVQIGDADTRDFWDTDWRGVDDWKRDSDGFRLEALDDGTFVFVPGEAIQRAYSFLESMSLYEYDEKTQEFVRELDYYGKPIQNIVKFLREDVVVFMIVSGRKVEMHLYELDPDPRGGES